MTKGVATKAPDQLKSVPVKGSGMGGKQQLTMSASTGQCKPKPGEAPPHDRPGNESGRDDKIIRPAHRKAALRIQPDFVDQAISALEPPVAKAAITRPYNQQQYAPGPIQRKTQNHGDTR